MGLGSAYQAGLSVPTPFDEELNILKGSGAWPQNQYLRGGGGGGMTRAEKPEKETPPGH